MREYVTCAAPPEGIDEEAPSFNRFCREQCATRRVARRCEACAACLCGEFYVVRQRR
jgi:hypothetical protein